MKDDSFRAFSFPYVYLVKRPNGHNGVPLGMQNRSILDDYAQMMHNLKKCGFYA